MTIQCERCKERTTDSDQPCYQVERFHRGRRVERMSFCAPCWLWAFGARGTKGDSMPS
jgi:hypothetical protein